MWPLRFHEMKWWCRWVVQYEMFRTSGYIPRFYWRSRCSNVRLKLNDFHGFPQSFHINPWWVPVTTAWCFLRMMMERPPDMEGNCEYIEWAVADSRQGLVLQLRGLGEALKTFRRKNLRCYETFHKPSGHLQDLGVYIRITLEWIFKKWVGSMDWIALAQDRDRWPALVYAVMNFRVA
jgi:hypothetical protein